MNILFLTIGRLGSVEDRGIYPDLLRKFRDSGHSVYYVSAREKRTGQETEFMEENGTFSLQVKIGNITKCNLIEKGLTTLQINNCYKKAVQKYFAGVTFDLVMYSTPPITLVGIIEYIKKRDGAKTYLLLKDIFPQNAVDLGMMCRTGLKAPIYWYFRHMEKKLYAVSNRIGCMSQANVEYVLRHNPEINPDKVEICPNSIEVRDLRVTPEERNALRTKYGIPLDKKVFVYGGNLGKPQGIPFIIECMKAQFDNADAFFLIVGDGTEYKKLETFFSSENPSNMKLMKRLPKEDYDKMVAACDVGLIFLDYRFTIPNFPSRLLSYMQAGIPVLACTDPNTDIGNVIEESNFGLWCPSNDPSKFTDAVQRLCHQNLEPLGRNAAVYLKKNYSVQRGADTILREYTGVVE